MFRPVPACGDSGRIVGRVDGICTSQFAAARSSTGRANQKAQNPLKLSDSAEPQSPVSSSFTYYPLRGSQTPLSEAIVREFSFSVRSQASRKAISLNKLLFRVDFEPHYGTQGKHE